MLTMPWISLRRLESGTGVEIEASAYRQRGGTIQWIDTDSTPPSSIRVQLRFLPSISQGIVVACIAALGTFGTAYLGYLSQLSGDELRACQLDMKGQEQKLEQCQENANLRGHLELTMGVLSSEQDGQGGKP